MTQNHLIDGANLSNREKILRRRQELRDIIRQAAIDEFAANGFAGASTQAIAHRAGITKAQLHYYISSKEDLYEEVLESIIIKWREIYSESFASDGPESFMREYIRRKIEFSFNFPSASRVFANEIISGAPFLGRRWGDFMENVRRQSEVIQSWIEDGLIAPVDPHLLQVHIWAVTQGYADSLVQIKALLQVPESEDLDIEHVVDQVTDLFMRGCGVRNA